MENSMEKSFTIGYFGVDERLRLTPASLAVYLQDLAVSHSDSIGYSTAYFTEHKQGWVIVNYHIKIDEMPKKDDIIKVKTWADFCGKIQAQRSFSVKNADGREIIRAVSRWALIDLVKRRPVRITPEMAERFSSGIASPMEADYRVDNGAEPVHIRDFTVTRRDTDSNGHVNNTKYFEWTMDDVPDDIYNGYTVKEIKASFKRECMRGAEVAAGLSIADTENGDKLVFSSFAEGGNPKSVFFEASSLWRKTTGQ